jgi:hypothetical protein
MLRRLVCTAHLAIACGCAAPAPSVVPSSPLVAVGGPSGSAGRALAIDPDAQGPTLDARTLTSRARLTAFVFFSAHCSCMDAHDDRLRALADAYGPRGVQFVMIDSEATATPAADAAEASRRGYPFAIVVDPGAKLAGALGADYATYSVVADYAGRVRYRGGIDSDRIRLHEDAVFYLRDAIDDLLAGREPRVRIGKTLGCALVK